MYQEREYTTENKVQLLCKRIIDQGLVLQLMLYKTCYANLQDFLEAKTSTVSRRRYEKSKSHNIMLACPGKSCRKTQQFEKKELAKVIMKKVNQTVDTRLMCQVCGNRNCIWKWRCYKCKNSSYKCTCKKPDSWSEAMPWRPTVLYIRHKQCFTIKIMRTILVLAAVTCFSNLLLWNSKFLYIMHMLRAQPMQ